MIYVSIAIGYSLWCFSESYLVLDVSVEMEKPFLLASWTGLRLASWLGISSCVSKAFLVLIEHRLLVV